MFEVVNHMLPNFQKNSFPYLAQEILSTGSVLGDLSPERQWWMNMYCTIYSCTEYKWWNYRFLCFPHSKISTWWPYQMDIFFVLLALCEGNPLVTSGFPSQRPVSRSFDVFFHLHLNKQLSKQSKCWWFVTPCHSLWCHCNNFSTMVTYHNCCCGLHLLVFNINLFVKYSFIYSYFSSLFLFV